MKIVMMVQSEDSNIYDIFYTFTFPEDIAPPGFIQRWRSISNASPIQPLLIQGKPNVFIGSTYDPDLDSFTMADGISPTLAKSLSLKLAVFLINNIVKGVVTIGETGSAREMLEAAYSTPVTVIEVDDNSEIKAGYTWDGTNFYPPLT